MLPEGPEVPQCLRVLEEHVAVLVHEHKDGSQMNKQESPLPLAEYTSGKKLTGKDGKRLRGKWQAQLALKASISLQLASRARLHSMTL